MRTLGARDDVVRRRGRRLPVGRRRLVVIRGCGDQTASDIVNAAANTAAHSDDCSCGDDPGNDDSSGGGGCGTGPDDDGGGCSGEGLGGRLRWR